MIGRFVSVVNAPGSNQARAPKMLKENLGGHGKLVDGHIGGIEDGISNGGCR